MNREKLALLAILSCFCHRGLGQAVNSTAGAAGAIPKYTDSTTLTPSAMTETNGNVGIGVTAPAYPLTIQGSGYSRSIFVNNGSNYGYAEINFLNDLGSELAGLGLNGSAASNPSGGFRPANAAYVFNDLGDFAVRANGDIEFINGSWGTMPQAVVTATGVGIGTLTPGTQLIVNQQPFTPTGPVLEVNGYIALSSGQGGSIIFSDGTVQSTAYTGSCAASGGDYAESMDVQGEKLAYEPGDVMVLSQDTGADITKSAEPYSTMVAGIYSTKPGYVGRRQLYDPKLATKEIPMAMIGVVPTKVSAENGAIHRGDLLVTSSLPGTAMKGTDHSRMIGAVVGKAMGSLESGRGVIEVLVTLQ